MDNNRIYIGPPGSGKTYSAKKAIVEIIWSEMPDEEKKKLESRFYNPENFSEQAFNYVAEHYAPGVSILSLHDGMTVSDFIEGLSVTETGGTLIFQNQPKSVLQLISNMEMQPDKSGFLLLDDVHRLNIASALGELLFAFTHRGEKITIPSGRTISIPENLYVFMTYNCLRPDYSIDIGMLSSFTVCYKNSSADILKNAVRDTFYKDAYYSIDNALLGTYYELLEQWENLWSKYSVTDRNNTDISSLKTILDCVPDMLRCPGDTEAALFNALRCPLTWTDSSSVKYKGQFNILGKKLYLCINDMHELYSQFYSEATVRMLSEFIVEVESEYNYYNRFMDYIAPEYYTEKSLYSIGYTYFLPGHGYSMWNARKLLQNKIISQVLPLLRQYKKEGIILCDVIPEIERVSTAYTRVKSEVEEDIIIRCNDDYRKIFQDSYSLRKSASAYRAQGGQKYNSNYGLLFELLVDIIEHPLINNWEIMDILIYDREIYFKLDESASWGSCLLCSSDLASSVVLGASDVTPGNNNGVYRSDLHAILYKGKKFYMVSKIKTENRGRSVSIEKCKQKKSVSREISLYAMAKLLVYKYLLRYMTNLKYYRNEILDVVERNAIDAELVLVDTDLQALDAMPLYGNNNDELRWNLLSDIRALPTWMGMINGSIRGAYKKMDNRYQTIMDSTGIHQMILQGPPGTSKTYGAQQFLAQQANLEVDGEWNAEELNKRQLITQGEDYSLPTEGIRETDNVFWDIIQFHPSYTYEDFVRGISVSTTETGNSAITGSILESGNEKFTISLNQPVSVAYKTVNRTLGKMAKIAKRYYNKDNPENSKKFYLVIDEINRANLATVFGELIYALEYRNSEVATPYSVGNESKLQIPSNLYIIGTMNTADKSISSIDYAIRRRFLFFPVLPDITVVYKTLDDWKNSSEIRLFHIIERYFDIYMNTDDYSRSDVQIGHTYFLKKASGDEAEEQMKNRFLYQVIPVLREYCNDGIIMPEVYGVDPEAYELDALELIREMINNPNMLDLDRYYQTLLEKLNSDQITEAIRAKLTRRNITSE